MKAFSVYVAGKMCLKTNTSQQTAGLFFSIINNKKTLWSEISRNGRKKKHFNVAENQFARQGPENLEPLVFSRNDSTSITASFRCRMIICSASNQIVNYLISSPIKGRKFAKPSKKGFLKLFLGKWNENFLVSQIE